MSVLCAGVYVVRVSSVVIVERGGAFSFPGIFQEKAAGKNPVVVFVSWAEFGRF